jgi:hypothetical protein
MARIPSADSASGTRPESRFSDEQRWLMVEARLATEPVVLGRADLTRSFIYARDYGVFYCGAGSHQIAMSLLLAFQHGCEDGCDVAEKLGLEYPNATADRWLDETPGAAFLSSVGQKVQTKRSGSLTAIERRLLGALEGVEFVLKPTVR